MFVLSHLSNGGLGSGGSRGSGGSLALLLISKTTGLVVDSGDLLFDLDGNAGDFLAGGGLKGLFLPQKLKEMEGMSDVVYKKTIRKSQSMSRPFSRN